MRPSLVLRGIHPTGRHNPLQRCLSACLPSTTSHRVHAPNQGHQISPFARYGSTSRLRPPPTRDLAVGAGACDAGIVRPHEYTAGCWLKQDKLQRHARHLDFDFAALGVKAIALCTRARSISSCIKLEGGFNKAFLYTMDSGERIVARIPTPIAGPRRLTTSSEVATMAYGEKMWQYQP